MALSVALLSLHHREPVSTYLTQMCRPRKAGQRQQQSPIRVWSPPAPPPPSRAEQSPQVTGWMTQTRKARHPRPAAGPAGRPLEGLGPAFPSSSWGSPLAKPPAPRPDLGDQRGQARGWRGDRAPVEGQGGVFLVPHCRDAGRTQGLRTGCDRILLEASTTPQQTSNR